jgi:hypothetical protein
MAVKIRNTRTGQEEHKLKGFKGSPMPWLFRLMANRWPPPQRMSASLLILHQIIANSEVRVSTSVPGTRQSSSRIWALSL